MSATIITYLIVTSTYHSIDTILVLGLDQARLGRWLVLAHRAFGCSWV